MAADHSRWRIFRGTARTWRVAVKNLDGTPKALGGATFRYLLATSWGVAATLDYVTAPNIVVTDAAAGLVEIRIPAATTLTLPAGKAVHEFIVTDASGESDPVFRGSGDIIDTLLATP